MRNMLLVSFDLLRQGEVGPSLAIGSLLAYLRSQPEHGHDYLVDFRSINLTGQQFLPNEQLFESSLRSVSFESFTHVAIGAYVWGESRIIPLMSWIRSRGFTGEFVLGGYQVSYLAGCNDSAAVAALQSAYPDARRFIRGYAEAPLKRVLVEADPPSLISAPIDFASLPSPYLSGVIGLERGQAMVRTETQRGCPYRCTFCAHRDTATNKVHRLELGRVEREFALFAEYQVNRINILDPVFNAGRRALDILDIVRESGLRSQLALQCRFETITPEFLDAVEGMNVSLEFGAQTLIPEEATAISRPNKLDHIDWAIGQLNSRGIAYEVSLIYGLPLQTLESFLRSIDWLQSRGVRSIKAWPLMILRGTEMELQRHRYQLREKPLGDFGIPVVTSSSTLSEDEWFQMQKVASELLPTERV